jgi:hypothetical protein
MAAERQDRPAAEHRMRVACRPTIGIKANALRQHVAALDGKQDRRETSGPPTD